MKSIAARTDHGCCRRSVVGGILGALALVAGAGNNAAGDTIEPPQGYISFDRSFSGPEPVYWNGTQTGFYNIDFPFRLSNASSQLAGTFWSNSIRFHNSTSLLPPNHVGGDQGGYIGVQITSATDSIAIFSVWWATDARPGPGANCVSDIEAWYNDDNPWEPRITSMDQVDADRPLAGGPFRSCRLPITLGADQSYRIRIWQLADARKPDDPEWWGAWLINDSKGTEQLIGQLQTPGSWGWLTGAAGGFIEHFGPMPQGCASIPPSTSRYDTVKADNGAFTSSISASVYGDCKADLDGRTAIECGGGECRVTVRDARPGAPAGISVSD